MNEYAAVNFNILKQQFINTRRNFKLLCFCISKGQVHFGRFAFLLFFMDYATRVIYIDLFEVAVLTR